MSEKKREEFLAYAKEFIKKVSADKKSARDFLIEVGIYTKEGKMAEPYQHLYIPPRKTKCIPLEQE